MTKKSTGESTKRRASPRLPKRFRIAAHRNRQELEQAIHDSFYRDQIDMDWETVSRMVVGLCDQVGFKEATKLLLYLAERTHQGWFGSTGYDE